MIELPALQPALAAARALYVSIALIVLALIAGVSLVYWHRVFRKSTRPSSLRRETAKLVIAIGLALTLMVLIVGVIVLVHYIQQR